MSLLAGALVACGVVILVISTIGLLTLPGFYARAHAVAKSETLGILLTLGGLLLYRGWTDGSVSLLIVLVISLIANPTAVHALARAAATTNPASERRFGPGNPQEPS